ncbi:hypothetical protein EV673_3040 [Limnobacter thiooxidans]|nr:hypothetical protein EV673_3040 [Limnobacter thiooxidans]
MPIEILPQQSGQFPTQFEGKITQGSYRQTGSSQQARVETHTDAPPQPAPARPESHSAFHSAARRIASAFSSAGSRLNALFSMGQHTPQAVEESARRNSLSTLFSKLTSLLSRKSGPQDGVDRQQSQTKTLLQRMFINGRLSQEAQREMLSEIKQQASALGSTRANPMFTFLDTLLPGPTASESYTPVTLIKPGHTAKLVLADLYEKKYGIKIHVQGKNLKNPDDIASVLLEKINAANGEPVGFVVHQPPEEETTKSQNNSDYRGHVTPFILQKTPNGFDVIDLNVGVSVFVELYRTFHSLNESGLQIRHLVLKQPARQADKFSCHTDALQVLKDALVAHKTVGGNLGEHYWKNHLLTPTPNHTRWEPGKLEYVLELPTVLHKVAQNSSAMKSTRLNPTQVLATRAPSANPAKKQTIGEHRERYSTVRDQNKTPLNNFLTIKAYTNAFKVLDQLRSFPDARARNNYIQTIQAKNGF